ncbi:hypothetical protein [Demequina gelatinilytica]|uniref:hypothetical protein n=1 Tax=Demequina gelatinilytica TaxID=1638980 RepID=UPI0007834995|nr:hypothetical protein [Demequina gelatinilytica]
MFRRSKAKQDAAGAAPAAQVLEEPSAPEPAAAPWPDSVPKVLVHIGMHKSATTVIQRAAAASRAELEAQGVTYAGTVGNHDGGTQAIWQPVTPRDPDSPQERKWRRLCQQIGDAPGQVLISAEHLAGSGPKSIARMAQDLDTSAQVVLTVRPLIDMVPSIWQQYVKERRTVAFPDWLEDVFLGERTSRTTPNFWRRHDLGDLVERWQAGFPDHPMAVLTLDKSRPSLLFDGFQELLGLEDGTLHDPSGDGYAANRGLSAEEVELVRSVNAISHKYHDGYYPMIRNGMVASLQRGRRPERDEGSIRVPSEWRDAIREVALEGIARARALGVREIGDLDRYADLGNEPTPAPGHRTVRRDTVAIAVAGIASRATASGVLFGDAEPAASPVVAPRQEQDTVVPVGPRAASTRLTVLAAHDLYHRLRAEGVDIDSAWRAARATRWRELHAGSAPAGPAPLCWTGGAHADAVGPAWGTAWSAAESIAALDGHAGPIDVVIELPTLSAQVSRAWERALVLGLEDGFPEWLAAAAVGTAGVHGGLPAPDDLVALAAALQEHPAVATVGVRLAEAAPSTRRLTVAESEVLRIAGRQHQGTDADAFGIAHVLLDGSAAALRRWEPCATGAPTAALDALAPYRAARAQALDGLAALGIEVDAARAWAEEADHGAEAADDAGAPLALGAAVAACAGAYAVAAGLDDEFTPGVSVGPMRRWAWRAAPQGG